jgi:hypothetical protein
MTAPSDRLEQAGGLAGAGIASRSKPKRRIVLGSDRRTRPRNAVVRPHHLAAGADDRHAQGLTGDQGGQGLGEIEPRRFFQHGGERFRLADRGGLDGLEMLEQRRRTGRPSARRLRRASDRGYSVLFEH